MFFYSLIVILNIVIMSDSSDLDFGGFLEGSFDIVKRQHNTVDSDSDISLDEDISDGDDHDENDMYILMEIMKRCAFRKNTVISVLFTLDMKFF